MNIMQLLTLVLIASVAVWAVETFIVVPLRQMAAGRKLAQGGDLSGSELSSLLDESALSKLMANVAIAAIVGFFLLVLILQQDFDISLGLVLITGTTGFFWLLYVAVTRRFRTALMGATFPDSSLPADKQATVQPALVEYSASFFPVLAVVLLLRSFLFEPFTIPSGSMLPSLQIGDYILVNKFAYGLRLPVLGTEFVPVGKPQRGDVMVFKYPENPSQNFIKRVIGVPGDHVRVENGHVYVNGSEMTRSKVEFPGAESWESYYREKTGSVEHLIRHEEGRESFSPQAEWVVPAGEYFMMGDNRDNSRDSRYWGFVPDKLIVGKAFYVWMHKDPGLHLLSFGRDGKVR